MQSVRPIHVITKAILLCAFANLAFAYFNPPVGKLSVYNWLVPGRSRFPFNDTKGLVPIVHSISVFENFDALFASHMISRGLKPPDEYRVIFLGDSSTWGFGLAAQDTLTEQINLMQLTTCNGLRVRAYNLGFPSPLAVRDLLFIERAQDYQPDLFVWLVTVNTFGDKADSPSFIAAYADELETLTQRYHLEIDMSDVKPASFWDKTIIGERSTLHRIALLQLLGMPWAATGVDSLVRASENASIRPPNDTVYGQFPSPKFKDKLIASLWFDALPAGRDKSHSAALLIVNEPIHILPGFQSSMRYNKAFPRWAYDAYHQALGVYVQDYGLDYLDLWDSLPDPDFLTNSSLHPSPAGERALAQRLAPEILQIACP